MKISPNSKRAFTLIELLVVISIIGMLSTVVMASLSSAREKGRIGALLKFDTYNNRKLGANIIAGYDFNNSSSPGKDISGNNNNLSGFGLVTGSTDPISGRGSYLNLTGGAVVNNTTLANPISFTNPSSKGFTVSSWIRRTAIGGADLSVLSIRGGSSIQLFNTVCTSSGSLLVTVTDPLPAIVNSSACNETGKWHNITVAVDDTTTVVYVDGKQVATESGWIPSQSINAIYVGGGSGSSTHIDEINVYNEYLLASEVEHLYAQGLEKIDLATIKK